MKRENTKGQTRQVPLDTRVDEIFRQLGRLQERVLRLRYGIGDGGRMHDHAEVARRLGISERRMRQIETETIEQLRHISLDG